MRHGSLEICSDIPFGNCKCEKKKKMQFSSERELPWHDPWFPRALPIGTGKKKEYSLEAPPNHMCSYTKWPNIGMAIRGIKNTRGTNKQGALLPDRQHNRAHQQKNLETEQEKEQ